MQKVKVIGAGLAGAECAMQLSRRGVLVDLFDIKPSKFTPAHHNPNFAELVCSNSLKNDTLDFASGLLKAEMRSLNSFVLDCADKTSILSGNTLAVDREKFAACVTELLEKEKNINIIEREIETFDLNEPTVIAAGPLCTKPLCNFIESITGESLFFYDALAHIVSAVSIDFKHAFFQDRTGQGDNDYINCPLSRDEYLAFWQELVKAERVALHDFEKNFEGCLPIEVMARRGVDVLRFGPLKPVGLEINGKTPYAVVQLRRENMAGKSYNMVGFQTNLTFPEQRRVFGMIPALRNAEWLRLGVMHRNTYINAPKYLNRFFQLKSNKNIMFAGQISGVEGYTESIASGLLCGINMVKYLNNAPLVDFGIETCLGALGNFLEAGNPANFQPMHINYGLLKPIDVPKQERKAAFAKRSLDRIATLKEDI